MNEILFVLSVFLGQVGTHQIFGEVDWETPSGTIDGANAAFTVGTGGVTITFVAGRLPQTDDWLRAFYWSGGSSEVDTATLMVFRNGILQLDGTDYNISQVAGGFKSGLWPIGL